MKNLNIYLIMMMFFITSVSNSQNLRTILQNNNLNFYEKIQQTDQFIDNAKNNGDSIDASELKTYGRLG